LTDNVIEIKNATKTFFIDHEKRNTLYEYLTNIFRKKQKEKIVILDNVSLSIKKGEILGILGLNGAGKTTLLKIISNIYKLDSGTVQTKGQIIPLLELGIGFNPEMTAKDNIITYGLILGFTKKQITQKIDEIVKFAELENFLDTKLKNFSSGMNARLAFATAVQINPDIILLDEILSIGDIPFQRKSFDSIMKFKESGKTIIFVSHALEQIERICNRVILLHQGKIIADGEPKTVIEKYMDIVNSKTK